MYIIGINGSPNKKGNTYYLLDKLLKYCGEQGAETEIINIPQVLSTLKNPFCTACSNPCTGQCYQNTELETTYNKLKKADGVFIGSPVYFGSASAQLKAFFDKSRKIRGERAFVNLVGAAVTVGGSKYGGQETTIKAIHDMMLVQGMIIIGDGHVDYDAGHHGVSAQRPAETDDFAEKRCIVLANRMIEVCRAIKDANLRAKR
ncbi:MAG: flavodoxin family protein [Clostridiaceae bacterium]|nr:flavodoxin family protein [Clostridiaceae bacterium]